MLYGGVVRRSWLRAESPLTATKSGPIYEGLRWGGIRSSRDVPRSQDLKDSRRSTGLLEPMFEDKGRGVQVTNVRGATLEGIPGSVSLGSVLSWTLGRSCRVKWSLRVGGP